MSVKKRPPKEMLEQWYLIENQTTHEIAERCHTDTRRVGKWFSYYKITARHTARGIEFQKALTKENLRQWYIIEKKTTVTLAKQFNTSHRVILNYLIKHQIPVRSNSEAQKLNAGTLDISDEYLKELYESGKSQNEIGQIVGLTQHSIRNRLGKLGVQARSKQNIGARNGMYGRTHTPESREKIRQANTRQFSNPENRDKHAALTCLQIQSGRTGKAFNLLEQKVAAVLTERGIAFDPQYRLGRFLYDFYLPATNMLLEVHGTFWHADPRFYGHKAMTPIQERNTANDARKQARAIQDGYTFRVIWEHDVDNGKEWADTI